MHRRSDVGELPSHGSFTKMEAKITGIVTAAHFIIQTKNHRKVCINFESRPAFTALQTMTVKSMFTLECYNRLNNLANE